MGCQHCKNGYLANRFGQDVECVNGILIDIDEYNEGWDESIVRPVAPCHPGWSKQRADENWSTSLQDIHSRLNAGQTPSGPADPIGDL